MGRSRRPHRVATHECKYGCGPSTTAHHDRMPVLLEPSQFDAWLDGSAGLEILKPAANDKLQRRAVSKRVNSSRTSDEDAILIEPVV